MNYTQKDLRNNHMPLLRRTQRQIDKVNEIIEPIQISTLKNIKLKELNDCYDKLKFIPQDSNLKASKNTKLSLYNKRK